MIRSDGSNAISIAKIGWKNEARIVGKLFEILDDDFLSLTATCLVNSISQRKHSFSSLTYNFRVLDVSVDSLTEQQR